MSHVGCYSLYVYEKKKMLNLIFYVFFIKFIASKTSVNLIN